MTIDKVAYSHNINHVWVTLRLTDTGDNFTCIWCGTDLQAKTTVIQHGLFDSDWRVYFRCAECGRKYLVHYTIPNYELTAKGR